MRRPRGEREDRKRLLEDVTRIADAAERSADALTILAADTTEGRLLVSDELFNDARGAAAEAAERLFAPEPEPDEEAEPT